MYSSVKDGECTYEYTTVSMKEPGYSSKWDAIVSRIREEQREMSADTPLTKGVGVVFEDIYVKRIAGHFDEYRCILESAENDPYQTDIKVLLDRLVDRFSVVMIEQTYEGRSSFRILLLKHGICDEWMQIGIYKAWPQIQQERATGVKPALRQHLQDALEEYARTTLRCKRVLVSPLPSMTGKLLDAGFKFIVPIPELPDLSLFKLLMTETDFEQRVCTIEGAHELRDRMGADRSPAGILNSMDEMRGWRQLVYPGRELWWKLYWVKLVRKYTKETRESIAGLSIQSGSSSAEILQGVFDYYSTNTEPRVREKGGGFQNLCGGYPIMCKDLDTDTEHASHLFEAADELMSRTKELFEQKTRA